MPELWLSSLKNPNIKSRKEKGPRWCLSARDLQKICIESYTHQSSISAFIFVRARVTHAAMTPTSFLESQAFVGKTPMTWPPCSPGLNPIEHLRSILKRGVYEGGEQFTSEDALCYKIVEFTREIISCQIKQLTSLVDKKFFLSTKSHVTKKWKIRWQIYHLFETKPSGCILCLLLILYSLQNIFEIKLSWFTIIFLL